MPPAVDGPGDDVAGDAQDDVSGEPTADDATGDGAGAQGEADDAPEVPDAPEAAGPVRGSGGRREVEVPDPLYKIVTVFSTLLSVLFVVLGFSVMDMARTVVSNPTGSLVVGVLSVAVPTRTLVEVNGAIALGVGLCGLALVALGAAVYVYGSRFRAPGMGKPKDEADEGTGDG